MTLRVAVLIPCYNEEAAIAQTVKDFRAALPMATVYVYDNNSTDQTIARATEAGAIVRSEPRQGKGNVVRRMFADIEADIYVMIDGDDTYDATVAPMSARNAAASWAQNRAIAKPFQADIPTSPVKESEVSRMRSTRASWLTASEPGVYQRS